MGEVTCGVSGRRITPVGGIRSERNARPVRRGASHEVAPTLLGRVVGGRYKFSELHRGTSVVYECSDLKSSQRVALKVPVTGEVGPDADVLRLYKEAQALGALKPHPNICRVLKVGLLENGVPFTVHELLHGETLRVRLERKGPLGFEAACAMTMQILEALAFAHAAKICT